MESSKLSQDIHSFDWDDSDLIKAYEKGMKIKEKALGKGKNPSAMEGFRPDKKQKYRAGSYCRALYVPDKQFYEAKIISVEGDYCTVEFLGYGDSQEINLKQVKDSFGKKARKKQMKKATNGFVEYSTTESETCGDTTDDASGNYSVDRKKLPQSHHEAYDYSAAESTFHAPYNAAPPMPAAMPFPQNVPFLPPPLAPPMPQCSTGNSSVSAMLVSWYMAGYYTGLHQSQKGCQSSQRFCSHSTQCCHH